MDNVNTYKVNKEAVKKIAEKVYDNGSTVINRNDLEELFPEFQESGDERMIKFIKQQLFNIKKTITENYELDAKLTKAIDWLEKQGNLMKALQISNANIGELVEKNYYLKEQLEKRGKNNMGISEATKQKLEDNLNKALEKETPESCNEFLEKQGEQKSIKEHNACEFCEDRYGCVSPCSMKLIEEEKFTNKVEPKFKIEEEKWYVCTQTFVLRGKIVVIKGQTYQAEKDNAIKGEDGCLFIDKHDGKASDYFRSWTIQDAKDGDVLYENDTETIFIFESQTCGWIKVYCDYWVSKDKFTGTDKADYGRLSEMKLTPATKEQRDLLFQKMKEAGYEWDAEKKELKKIEQKKELTDFEFSLKHIIEEAIECGDIHNLKADADMLLRLVQKSSWSEEDKKMHDFAIRAIGLCKQYAINHQVNGYSNLPDVPKKYEELQDWLISLKPQFTWKPSDEQMNAIDYVKNFDYGGYKDMLVSLYYDLKKLK